MIEEKVRDYYEGDVKLVWMENRKEKEIRERNARYL